MPRSTKDSWLTGPGDLQEADVHDVPSPGQTVRVRGLAAKYTAEIQGQLKLTQEGREQVAKIDVPAMERLQFAHGCIDPVFTAAEAAQIQEKYGPAFRKVIAEIDRLSGIDKEALEKVEQTFPAGGASEDTSGGWTPAVVDDAPGGDARSDLPVRTGA